MESADNASALPWVHFWLFGPEFGCVKRELPIVRALGGRARRLLLVHPRHEPLLREVFANDPTVHVQAYRHGLHLAYRPDFDLDLRRTTIHLLKFAAYRWLADWRMFRRAVREHFPAVIVNDFLPQVSLWARWQRLPCIGVYNYALHETDFGRGPYRRLLSLLVPTLLRLAYWLPRRMFIETLYDRVPRPAVRIPLIRRFAANEGTAAPKHRYFLALGGHSQPQAVLDYFERVAKHAPGIQLLIAPRHRDEPSPRSRMFEQVPLPNPLQTELLYTEISGVITKAGFTTVAEALQTGKALFLLPLASHPEIRETERTLLQTGRATVIRLTDPPERTADLLRHPPQPKESLEELFGGEQVVLQEILRYLDR
ncbi:MAG: hypothetical protein Q9P90_02385 [candidate division KSB1 bacterium]|nr:hypothetical protein [candidate division KSB1 bacterium]